MVCAFVFLLIIIQLHHFFLSAVRILNWLARKLSKCLVPAFLFVLICLAHNRHLVRLDLHLSSEEKRYITAFVMGV